VDVVGIPEKTPLLELKLVVNVDYLIVSVPNIIPNLKIYIYIRYKLKLNFNIGLLLTMFK